MAITSIEAIRFCNEKIRPGADRMAQLYYFAKMVSQEWNANNMGSLLPATSDVVRDSASPTDDNGTSGDGRHVITSNDVQVLKGILDEFITNIEAASNQDLNGILAVAVNINP